jgi:hypothetical protein
MSGIRDTRARSHDAEGAEHKDNAARAWRRCRHSTKSTTPAHRRRMGTTGQLVGLIGVLTVHLGL